MTQRVCTLPDCGGKHVAKGYCGKHYAHFKRHGDALAPQERVRGRRCGIPSCHQKHEAKGMCKKHYERDKAGQGVRGVGKSVVATESGEPVESRKEYLDRLWAEIQERRRVSA